MEKFLNGQHIRWIAKDGYSHHGRYIKKIKKLRWKLFYTDRHLIIDDTDMKVIYMTDNQIENLIEWYDKDFTPLKPIKTRR